MGKTATLHKDTRHQRTHNRAILLKAIHNNSILLSTPHSTQLLLLSSKNKAVSGCPVLLLSLGCMLLEEGLNWYIGVSSYRKLDSRTWTFVLLLVITCDLKRDSRMYLSHRSFVLLFVIW
ncbi:hypothetical protein Ccrd_010756 [Cynara cardunculus var. scolymus]|uniref:Uncharacterized protein n=1 Tax=Cynara cardunculus var. scolymus TaxID=59895 RepID=A0A103YKN2_CYNCS|nr:hypothetical protein Ccrd_010756 [Cynara cardunculus var. scolymus]